MAEAVHSTVILDRSGSMENIRDDTIGGFNSFLATQQAIPGETTLSLVQFDSQDPYEIVFHALRIGEISPLTRETFVPRGGTPLLDALGRGMNDTASIIGGRARILFAVVTDGQENASREFRKSVIARMIAEKQHEGWQFAFLSADLDAIQDAKNYGVNPDATLHFQKDGGSKLAWESLSKMTSKYRGGSSEVGF
ncbi:MAG: Mg-chelatase subunit ChlD [Rhodothermales bacterium]|jgi:Mg-chelatase subunit ChlD